MVAFTSCDVFMILQLDPIRSNDVPFYPINGNHNLLAIH